MRRRALVFVALCAAGCSVVAGGGEPSSWPCVVGEPDYCREVAPIGQRFRCVAAEGASEGVCGPCDPVDVCGNGIDDDCDGVVDNGSAEVCNGADDDCDGVIDNGLDEDGDTYTWCPTGPAPIDCDDSNPFVHPTRAGETPLREICDGLDNDCNPSTPDGSGECDLAVQDCDGLAQRCVDINCLTRPLLCSAEEFCDENATPPICRARDMTCFNPDYQCPEGQVCNPANATCVTPRGNGTPCDFHAECESALCLPVPALRLVAGHVGDRGGVCGRSCCSDRECDAGHRCWASGSGARACVPTALLAMGRHGVPAPETCAARSSCTSGQECRITLDSAYEVADRYSVACGAAYRARISCSTDLECFFSSAINSVCIDRSCQRATCFGASDCPTGICAGSECRESCGTSGDCGRGGACGWVFVRSSGAARDDFLPACTYNSTGTGIRGAECASDADCRDRTCVDATGNPAPPEGTPMRCTDTCCADASCQENEQCRPIFVHGRWEHHCLPRPFFGRVAMSR
ncbi:MAG: putative metal-binding motif-containing protein [Sandaracinaceae bacterium]|nr:putative metal-binding motif-containing protein [Sandaracinaceae bacterium]